MSYSTSIGPLPKDELLGIALDQAFDGLPDQFDDDDGTRTAVRSHLDAAKRALAEMAGCVGRSTDSIYVTITGHANPDHGPRPGWSNETFSMYISVADTNSENSIKGTDPSATVPPMGQPAPDEETESTETEGEGKESEKVTPVIPDDPESDGGADQPPADGGSEGGTITGPDLSPA